MSSTWRRSAPPASRSASIRSGGAAVHYWQPIIERYGIAATVVNDAVDPTFRFMTVDWDGKIRMDCSSPYAMARLIGLRDKFDVAFANDTDADRHGIVDPLQRADESEPLSGRRDRLSVRASPALAQGQRGRQDRRQQRDHRPRREEARPQAGRNAGRLQMVRRRPDRRRVRLRRRGKRRRLVPAARRNGVDHRQGRPHPRPAGRRDDGADQTRSEPAVRQSDQRTRRALLRADRRAGDAGAEESAEGALAGKARDEGTRRRAGR